MQLISDYFRKLGLASVMALVPVAAQSHPHVFAEASMEIVRNEEGAFSELRQVWRFDELFTTSLQVDFDDDADGKLDAGEIRKISNTVRNSIAEYDFYTAMRAGEDVLLFEEPHEFNAYIEDGQFIILLAIKPEKPYKFDNGALRLSASDETYYVAFEFMKSNITVSGGNGSCSTDISVPDFDQLYASNSQALSESFFSDNTDAGLGDEFYSWAEIKC